MKTCLYCQRRNALERDTCEGCGMPLPASEASGMARRLSRFQWFCVGLTLFCIAMFLWLPRDIY